MRKVSVLLAGCLTVGLLSCQEKKNDEKENDHTAPEAVQMAFQKKYPGEDDPDWKQDEHGYWESSFKKDGEKFRADFNKEGSWIETENDVKNEELPEAIKKQIEEKYSDYEITEIEFVDNAKKGKFYDVEFKKEGKNLDVMFKENGTIIE